MSIHGVLGESTHYPTHYDPSILFPIARSLGREQIGLPEIKTDLGMDWWHAFEVSWLNHQGLSQVAMARFAIPADSTHIIESKSLKLYLNSLNFTEFQDWQTLKTTIEKDLSSCVHAQVKVELFSLNPTQEDLMPFQLEGECLEDNPHLEIGEKFQLTDDIQPDFLKNTHQDIVVKQCYYSHLLRSNCPVTNQPDWGTIQIEIESTIIDKTALLKYLLSFRKHNGFHEQCVEQVFADLTKTFKPKSLMVRAWYTRRGGIDINPCRVSDIDLLPQPSRLIRQ